jgi:hypothetical protein
VVVVVLVLVVLVLVVLVLVLVEPQRLHSITTLEDALRQSW